MELASSLLVALFIGCYPLSVATGERCRNILVIFEFSTEDAILIYLSLFTRFR